MQTNNYTFHLPNIMLRFRMFIDILTFEKQAFNKPFFVKMLQLTNAIKITNSCQD